MKERSARVSRPILPPAPPATARARIAKWVYGAAYGSIVALFFVCAAALIVLAGGTLLHAVHPGLEVDVRERLRELLEGIGLLTIAVASLELSQTVLEEEVQREASMSTPTRARRVLSRFMLVVVVSLSVEFLVLVFELIHQDTSRLPHAAAVGFGAAALLAGWALFVKYNAAAEELEPEAMEEVKREDDQVG